jgi:TolA-binding protein
MATVSQLSQDPALETSLFWDQYKIPIIAAVVVLLLGGLSFAGYQIYEQRRASAAAAQLAAAKTQQEFQQVIQDYSGTNAAASAYLLLAEQQRNEKKYADANATLHKFIDSFPKHELITTAWMGVAANLISLGKNDEALSTYQRLVVEYPQSYNAPLALLAQVPMLKAKGRPEEARRACETIISQYRDSIVMSDALRELQKLPGKSAPAAKSATKPAASPAPAKP